MFSRTKDITASRAAPRSLNVTEAAEFLKISEEEVKRRLRRGEIPGVKPGKRWVIMEQDLVAYFDSLYARKRQASLSHKEAQCSTNVVVLTGWTSPRPTGSGLDALLAQRAKSKRRSSTTGSKQKPGDR
ncbi:helix-turn-helix domain-containing protein [Candidatus Igneacidithiobacillus taiwanensis]|uniref:helix-turn-helix domain-containing protein n=1 Tax=Candidatus Igneacidithiobacillus taiwanensis TaxID=1945924 RepID=UPI003917112F